MDRWIKVNSQSAPSQDSRVQGPSLLWHQAGQCEEQFDDGDKQWSVESSTFPYQVSLQPCISRTRKTPSELTAWLLNTFISLSPLTIRLFDDGSLKWVITLSFWVLNAFPQERKLQLNSAEKRTRVVRELLKSERKYVQMLEIVRDVYVRPLRAALSSNRAILSAANIQIMFSDILQILCLNR